MEVLVFNEKNNIFISKVVKGKGRIKEHAKFSVIPEIKLIENQGLQINELKMAEMVITENAEIIIEKWNAYFSETE